MTKKDILEKIKKAILGEGSETPGISVTNKVKGAEKKFNDEYYGDVNKKFKDYSKIEKDKFKTPKVNADEKQESTYGGSGMEGLTYDNEGTEVEKTFTKKVKDLNKPSKDYYLKKDEVNDVYDKLDKKAKLYKKQKKVYQNTPPVRAIEAEKVKTEGTIKRLTYTTEFVNESTVFNLIPENFKQNNLVFEMTDGNKTYKIRWEGSQKGRPTVLLFKDSKKINEELDRMHKLFEYNPRNNFAKSNLLTEEEELHNMMDKFRGKDEVVTGSTAATAITKKLSEPIKVGPTDIFYKGDTWRYDANNIGKMGDDEFWSKIKDVSVDLSQNFEPTTILSLLQRLGNSFLSHPTLKNDSKVKNWGATLKNEINLGQVSSYLR